MANGRPGSGVSSGLAAATHFASPQRSSPEDLRREAERIAHSPVVDALLGAADGMLAVLNEHRQVVALNLRLLEALGVEDPRDALGLRPGEAVGCVHAHDNPEGGCGTGRMCASCGAAVAIVSALVEDRTEERLCCIRTAGTGREGDLHLSVRAHPLAWDGARWALLFMQDVSERQNWALLQRVFFHDITNLVTALVGNSYCLEDEVPEPVKEQARSLERYCKRLAREVALQHMLLKSETEQVELDLRPVGLDEVMADLRQLCDHHPAGRGKRVRFDDRTGGRELKTDPVVLDRVLANMVVNALEATEAGGLVRVWCEVQAGRIVFCVSNPGEMPVEIAGRVFQRNFSTKGELGRGLGTWSMKLFGEKLLGGEVDFSSPGTGQTVFSFRLPIERD